MRQRRDHKWPQKIIENFLRELCEGGGKRRGRSGKDSSRAEMSAARGIRNGTGRQEDSPVPHDNKDLLRH
jgi:hypothetical protein